MRSLSAILLVLAGAFLVAPAIAADAAAPPPAGPPPLVDLEDVAGAAQQGGPPLEGQPVPELPEEPLPLEPLPQAPAGQPAPPTRQEQADPPSDVDVPQEVGQDRREREEASAVPEPVPTAAPAAPPAPLPNTGWEVLLPAVCGYVLLLAGLAIARAEWLSRAGVASQGGT